MGWVGVILGVLFTFAVFYALLDLVPRLVNRRAARKAEEPEQ